MVFPTFAGWNVERIKTMTVRPVFNEAEFAASVQKIRDLNLDILKINQLSDADFFSREKEFEVEIRGDMFKFGDVKNETVSSISAKGKLTSAWRDYLERSADRKAR